MSSNVFDLVSQVRIVLGIKSSLKSICPEFRENLRSEFEINVAYYPIREMV